MLPPRVIALGLCCAAQSITCAAWAEDSVALSWQGGPGTESCSKPQEIQRAAEVQLGRNVFSAAETAPKLTIVVKVERRDEPRGFHATIWVEADDRRDPGMREFDAAGDDCGALDEPLALVVALMADSELARPVEPEEPAPPPEPEPPPPPTPKPRVNDESDRDLAPIETAPPEPPAPWRAEIGVSALGGYAVLPSLSVGADLAFVLKPGAFPAVMLHGAAFYPRAERLSSDASVRFFFAHGGIGLCPELWSSKSALLRGCVGPALGAVRAESEGLIDGRDTTRLVIASELGLRGRVELGGGALLTAAVSFLLPLKPETFTYTSDGRSEDIFQMGHLVIMASLGAAFEIR